MSDSTRITLIILCLTTALSSGALALLLIQDYRRRRKLSKELYALAGRFAEIADKIKATRGER